MLRWMAFYRVHSHFLILKVKQILNVFSLGLRQVMGILLERVQHLQRCHKEDQMRGEASACMVVRRRLEHCLFDLDFGGSVPCRRAECWLYEMVDKGPCAPSLGPSSKEWPQKSGVVKAGLLRFTWYQVECCDRK